MSDIHEKVGAGFDPGARGHELQGRAAAPADYLIWSEEHHAWWRPAERGYTSQMKEAGRYSKERADRIVAEANYIGFNEVAIPIPPQLEELSKRGRR